MFYDVVFTNHRGRPYRITQRL